MSVLRGARVVVTRSAARADRLVALLASLDAVPVLFPAIRTIPPESTASLDDALRRLGQYDWVVFTSAAGVRSALDRASELGLTSPGSPGWADGCRFAAVGPATVEELARYGIGKVAQPDEFTGDAIPSALGPVEGLRFLLLRADRATRDLPEKLASLGGRVDDVVAYRTVPLSTRIGGRPAEDLRAGVDAVTFTSPSTVEGFLAGVGEDWPKVLGDAVIVTIGPVTSDAVRAVGLHVDAEADPHTIDGLVAALVRRFEARREHSA